MSSKSAEPLGMEPSSAGVLDLEKRPSFTSSPAAVMGPANHLKTADGAGWSIATRLTVLYTLSAFGILCLALTFLYWELSVDLHDQEDQSLVDEITTLRV